MTIRQLFVLTYVCSVFSFLSGAEVWGARLPAPSPDGEYLTFSYRGDIWIVKITGGKAERLTDNTGYESKSLWSPDSKWIAFVTDRWGSDDICIIPAGGSQPPRRLTYYSTYDALYAWTPDSRKILFGSHRTTLRPALYSIDIDSNASMPVLAVNFETDNVCLLPGTTTMLYARNGARWWRKRYAGGADMSIWKMSLPHGISTKIIDSPGRDGYPMYSRATDKVYFVSNRAADRVNNIWCASLDGSSPEQVTHEKEEVLFPEMSFDGTTILYECFGEICKLDVLTSAVSRISIQANDDYKENPVVSTTFTSQASEFALSPDEKTLAFVVHGDIYVMEIKKGYQPGTIVQITTTPYIERHVSWHPHAEKLIYTSMADGDMDIYTVTPKHEKRFCDDLVFDIVKLADTDEAESKPSYSPDGTKIAYFKNQRELYVMNNDGSARNKLCPENDVLWMDWSPDSKWITFSRTALGWREDVYIVPSNGSENPINISNHPNDDYKPMWSADGRRIAFASRDAVGNLWMKYVFLREEDEDHDDAYWKEHEGDTLMKDISVAIDFNDIEERIHTVVRVLGYYNYVAQSPDGKLFAIHSTNEGRDDIWTVDWRGKELKDVTKTGVNPRQFTVTRDKNSIVYLNNQGQLVFAEVNTTQSRMLPFKVQIWIDEEIEREQVFTEAWWALQDGFYDSDFHGVDWKAMYEKYRELAVSTRTVRDFHSVVHQMIGELNASHLGIWKDGGPIETTGVLGIIVDQLYDGQGVRIKETIPDSPADKPDVHLKPGDIITHINGIMIGLRTNIHSLLNGKVDDEILLTVRTGEKTHDVKITPVTPWKILSIVKDNWITDNEQYVESHSGGKIGYLYIASMGSRNLRQFEHDLYKAMDKDGLIIDIRYNGGGSIHDELLNILRRTAYLYSIERNGAKEYNSLFRWDKPTAVLINEYCYSDAEIFPAGFRELNLGTVVGVPTFGAVIGTNNIRLLDGSWFRVPGTGWFTLTGENLENTPVEPDIYVENSPEEDGSSEDHQLRKALEVLIEQLSR
jgi:tricorn protease